jgi:predicted ester cyclase
MTDARELMTRMFEIVDGKRWDEYTTVVHSDIDFVTPQGAADAAGWVVFSQGFAAAFPDGKHTILSVVQDGDLAALEGVWVATHTGPMDTPQGTIPPTGARVELKFCGIGTIRDGKFASVHVYFDQLSMLGQLGLLPEPAVA